MEGKLLSKAGKEILIKAVAHAIPTYTMSYFKIPYAFGDHLMSMIRKILVGAKIRWQENGMGQLGEAMCPKV